MSARVGIALIAVAIALLITASAGASVVSMDRPISVQVVDDEHANVAVEPVEASVPIENESANDSDTTTDATTQPDDEVELLTVTNRLEESIEVTTLEASNGVDIEAAGTEVGSGNSTALEGTVSCADLQEEPTATVELDGSGVTISQTVDLEVSCEDASA